MYIDVMVGIVAVATLVISVLMLVFVLVSTQLHAKLDDINEHLSDISEEQKRHDQWQEKEEYEGP
jgi:hypothetical protein